ncbi:Protein dopey [Tolypocladium paradoxum]|uniref:Protein dopey n=1 Tax=Tolypocladium paradoxum TaxID=94208 RepID=A0A2S4L149_9HYPO|nr:Protein dopey [Tolypocladium paradoxum]
MALEPGSGALAGSPESSGRDSPIPRQWRNQLGGGESPIKDKSYRRYASGVEKALSLFETALEEWADYISFLNKLLKALQARPSSITTIPTKATVAKRLSQCLNPSLPSGVHQKALEVYNYVFTAIGKDGLSRDLPLYLPGLAPTLSFASLSVRSPFLDLLETHFLRIDPRSLRPAMKSIILALLPGLEDETSEDFDRTLGLVASFKDAIRPRDCGKLTDHHSSGDDFFWQCFFLASITSQSRRSGALAYLVRYLPVLGPVSASGNSDATSRDRADENAKISAIVTSPEPGLLVRCFASGLADEQLLIQRGFLDLLVSHLPLNSHVLQSRVKPADLELLLKAAAGVVTRRDMSLNRRLWAWLLGPGPVAGEGDNTGDLSAAASEQQQAYLSSRTGYFEEFGLQPLTNALLDMIKGTLRGNATERARPYRICLSLMDRWEIGGLVVPEVFLPVVESVRQSQSQISTKAEFTEVLRSASVFFDGIESGLIYSELVGLLAQAIGPGSLSTADRSDRISLVSFIATNFNVREEEMVTIHAPLTCLAALSMLEDSNDRKAKGGPADTQVVKLFEQVLSVVASLLELVPDRAFPSTASDIKAKSGPTMSMSNVDILRKIRAFYVHEQGNLDASPPPFNAIESGELLLQKAVRYICEDADLPRSTDDLGVRNRILILILLKTPTTYQFDVDYLLSYLKGKLGQASPLAFSYFSSILQLATQLYSTDRISATQLSDLVPPLVHHAWSYLSASDPKYHVETVRCLWQLQTALTLSGRDIEAALSGILVDRQSDLQSVACSAEAGRTFGVLWSHTLQDTASDRRGSRTQTQEYRSAPRLAGMDHYQVMLTQPLFLVLDALLDERAQLYMVVKSWLNSMIGIDRLFLLFVAKISTLPFLLSVSTSGSGEKVDSESILFGEDDDLDLCLYYLRTLHHVLRCTSEVSRAVLASKYLYFAGGQVHIRAGAEEDEMTLQDFFVRICMKCVMAEVAPSASAELVERVSQLHRYALTILHQFLLSRYAAPLASLHLDNILIDRLSKSIGLPDPYVQVLLLDVIYDTLKLQDMAPGERPTSPTSEKVPPSLDRPRASRASIALSDSRPVRPLMSPQLLKCLQAGLSSSSSHTVLDSWVSFLGDCLPFYSNCIFQILIPLVETLCGQIGAMFSSLRDTFHSEPGQEHKDESAPESTLIYLLNGLEQVLARSHDQLLAEETRAQMLKGPEQPQSLFGSMVSGVFQSDGPQSRSATANDRLTVHLAFQDAMRICYKIWSWGQGDEAKKQDPISSASFTYTSLRMRNRARRLLEHLFTAETLECLETVVDIWKSADSATERTQVFNFLSALDACRPRHSIPALFNSIYSRTNPIALEPSRKSTMTISLQDSDLVFFLVEYARSLDDDAMDEIWQDCIIFLKDLLGNPFPHRQTLPSLLEFAGILGEKVDNTNFGEQRRMRRELGDLFLRLLAALFTTRPITFSESTHSNGSSEKSARDSTGRRSTLTGANDGPDDVVSVLVSVVPNLPKILLENDRVLSAAGTISTNIIGPTLRSKSFPDTVSQSTLKLLHELSRLQNNQKTWKKDVGEAFNDGRFFSMKLNLVKDDWLPLLKQWILTDKEKMPEIVSRISAPTTAGIVFGVGATSARLEADRKTQLNLRRIATLVLASAEDAFVADLQTIFDKLVELLAATSTSSPSSTTRADVYMVVRALVLKTSAIHLAMLWPVVNAEIHAAISSVVAPDHSAASDAYVNTAVLQACKLLDLLICVAPDDFQLHEWLFVTDTIDAVYRSSTYQPVALVDELSEELGSVAAHSSLQPDTVAHMAASGSHRRPLLGLGGISDEVSLERKDELVAKILRPFFGQLSIFAFESTYAMGALDREACTQALLKDIFDERTMVRAL